MELSDYAPLFDDDEDSEAIWEGYASDGLVSISGSQMRVTPEGRHLLPHLLAS